MKKSLFEGAATAAFYAKFRPQPPGQLIVRIKKQAADKLSTENNRLGLAADVGCGSGQCTSLLADHFDKVIGFDVSANQIKEANGLNRFNNISYRVSNGRDLPLQDETVDVITCCQAFHWLDREVFYYEVRRVLKPGGLLALLTYEMPHVESNDKKSEGIRLLVRNIYKDERLKPHWASKERDLVDAGYLDVSMPFIGSDIRINDVTKQENISENDIIGYLKSWSGYNLLLAKDPESAKGLERKLINDIKTLAGKSVDEESFSIEFPFHLIMSQKPINDL